ncbi:primase-helicase family protein [Lacipirellula sp.]|uniref:primase-helicase family protein n=1 Tax=Lacipirellula sp. TaxID=2691419 RepID=UPI003D0D2398
MDTVLQGLDNFLAYHREQGIAPDLLARWHPGMETQVLVSSVGGWPVEEKPGCYTDGMKSWWNIRVPKNADSEPEFNDYPLNWAFGEHADCIGSTGWDWQARTSRWVGFDFDALVGHAKGVGVSDDELNAVRDKAQALPYVEVRRSTGGAGLHLYVHVDVPTENHTVHSALARCVLGMMSSETGFDFASRIDCCGGNMWIWRKDLEPGGLGLSLIKAATHYLTESDLPANWRDHIAVVKKGKGKLATDESVAALSTAIKEVPLDEEHKALMTALSESGYTTIWMDDYHCLHTKTKALQNIFDAQNIPIKGVFRTVSEGNNPAEPNCYMFPVEGGAWRVYRFGTAKESPMWSVDSTGRSNCFFNCRPSLRVAAKFHGGAEDADTGEFVFPDHNGIVETVACLGDELTLPPQTLNREVRLGSSKDGRLVVKIKKGTTEANIAGWVDKGKWFYKVLESVSQREELCGEFDEVFRKLVGIDGDDAGWVLRNENEWVECVKDDIKNRLEAVGVRRNDINPLLGNALYQPWKLVNLPFQVEYPGGRQWNLNAAQLAYQPADDDSTHPTWDLVLKHSGADLDDSINELDWCREDYIFCGGDYLKAWIACMIRCPFEPLPYLFFFGKQNHGKSTFHEAASLLMTKGCVRADRALKRNNEFNGELANAILCVIEETNIAVEKNAIDKIKDWVTSPMIAIRQMRTDQYMTANSTKWVQCNNFRSACPVFKDDTRIVVMHVREPDADIPKEELKARLRSEAPAFMRTLMTLKLPTLRGRLRLPVIETENKRRAAELNSNAFEEFAEKSLERQQGKRIDLKEFNDRFLATLSDAERNEWGGGAKCKDLAQLVTPVETKRGSCGMQLVDVRWANTFALSV